jgi:hypothetical protein
MHLWLWGICIQYRGMNVYIYIAVLHIYYMIVLICIPYLLEYISIQSPSLVVIGWVLPKEIR